MTAGPKKNIQNRGAPVSLASPCTRHSAYSSTCSECARQNHGYARLRITGCANTKIMHIITNSRTPLTPGVTCYLLTG